MLFKKFDFILEKVLEFIITLCMASVVIITFLQVFFRYVLKQPLTWSQEALLITFVYSVLFGAALAVKNQEHLKVEIFEKVSPIIKKIFDTIQFIVVLIFIIIIIYYGYELVRANFKSGQIVGMLPVKKAYVYMALPISGLFMLYFHIKKVFE